MTDKIGNFFNLVLLAISISLLIAKIDYQLLLTLKGIVMNNLWRLGIVLIIDSFLLNCIMFSLIVVLRKKQRRKNDRYVHKK